MSMAVGIVLLGGLAACDKSQNEIKAADAASNRAVDSLKAHPPPTVRRKQVAHEARGERVGGVEAELDELLPAALHDPGGDTIRSAGNLGGSLPQGIISR